MSTLAVDTANDGDLSTLISSELEQAWGNVFTIVNHFLLQHDKLGFELIQKKANPRLEDMLLSFRSMGCILNLIESSKSFDHSEQRMLINARQQILLFEQAVLALQDRDESEYSRIINLLRTQAQF